MATKKSKIGNMMKSQGEPQGTVFDGNIFGGISSKPVQINEDENTYAMVSLEDILISEVEYPKWLYETLETGSIVSPIFLSYEYVEKEKAGRKYKDKTGKYRIVDGQKRVYIYSLLLKKAQETKNESQINKYKNVQALILPISKTEEEIQQVRKSLNENKMDGAKEYIRDVMETRHEEISFCYQYQKMDVPFEKLVVGKNEFKITQSEVDALEQSIYTVGLLQPIVVLPQLNRQTMETEYLVKAGHKRRMAIGQLLTHAKQEGFKFADGMTIDSQRVVESFKEVPAFLIPMGASQEQIEKIYQDTNILSRHMSAEDMFEHIEYIQTIPSRPRTKEEFNEFKNKKYKMNPIVREVQDSLRKLGFPDYKDTSCKTFMTVYYYGSDKAIDMYKNAEEYGLTKKQIQWVVRQNKDFNERKEQDKILIEAIRDRTTLVNRMAKKSIETANVNQTITSKGMTEKIIKQKAEIEKLSNFKFDTKPTAVELTTLREILEEFKESIKALSENIDAM